MTDTLLCIYLGAENPKSVADSSKIGIGYMIYVCIMYINLHVALHTPPVSITIVYIAEWRMVDYVLLDMKKNMLRAFFYLLFDIV